MSIKLSREEQYGIMALIDLSSQTATNGEETTTVERVRTIANRQNIPARFLEQIFSKFRQADIVVGKRGPQGGYRLSRDAKDITLDTVMEALRPNVQATELGTGLAQVVNSVWSEIELSFNQTLNGVTLADLQERASDIFTETVVEGETTSEVFTAPTVSNSSF